MSAMTADHYFTTDPTGDEKPREVTFMVAGRVYRLTAAAGVFSADRLDPGTAVLLRKAPPPSARGGVYLDLGCGYGPIAVALAATSAHAVVYAVDVNNRALELVAQNAERSGVAARVHPCTPDQVPDDLV